MNDISPPSGFAQALNAQGYGFQHAIIAHMEELRSTHKSNWLFEGAELPVASTPVSTRIDAVLRHESRPAYLIAECKRVNPALGAWCFARAPFRVQGRSDSEGIVFERARLFTTLEELRSEGVAVTSDMDVYHIALEMRTAAKGDAHSSGRGAIEDAMSQVLRGLNGFVTLLAGRTTLIQAHRSAMLFPVVFTTASLWRSTAQLDKAALDSGNLDPTTHSLSPLPWLLFQYHQSPDLAHTVPGNRVDISVARTLEIDFTRTIAIVSPAGVEAFLKWAEGCA